MKYLAAAMSCFLAVGCTEAAKPARTDVTTNKPVTSNDSTTAHDARDTVRTNDTSRANDTSRVNDTSRANDNSRVNARDRNDGAKTPLDQNENKKDIKITADIRKQVVADKMSVDAENVKIITQNGKVTLRGPVKSADEKQRIENIAVQIAGAEHVDNQLEVVTKN